MTRTPGWCGSNAALVDFQWRVLEGIWYETLPVKYVTDQNFEHLELLCSDTHPYHIFYPKESPRAINEPINNRQSGMMSYTYSNINKEMLIQVDIK